MGELVRARPREGKVRYILLLMGYKNKKICASLRKKGDRDCIRGGEREGREGEGYRGGWRKHQKIRGPMDSIRGGGVRE